MLFACIVLMFVITSAACVQPEGTGRTAHGGPTGLPVLSESEQAYRNYTVNRGKEPVLALVHMARAGRLDALGYQRLGFVLFDLWQWEACVAALEHSLKLDPRLSRSWMVMGEALAVLSRNDDAERAKGMIDASSFDDLGAVLDALSEGDPDAAIRHAARFERALAGRPGEVTALAWCLHVKTTIGLTNGLYRDFARLRFESTLTSGLLPALSSGGSYHDLRMAAIETLDPETSAFVRSIVVAEEVDEQH